MTEEQSRMLATLEQQHGRIIRVPDDSPIAEALLCKCVTDTRAYMCADCGALFTIEPDGATDVWMSTPLVD